MLRGCCTPQTWKSHMAEELPRAFLGLLPADTSMSLEADKPGSVPRLPVATASLRLMK